MPLGLLTGLGAALAWGTLDIFSALASRRIGSLRVTTGIQIVGAIAVILIAILSGTTLPADPAVILGAMVVGLAGAGAYLTYFTGLRIGPIAVVSGTVAAYGGLTVILAVILRGETLTPIQALGAAVSTVGVILAGLSFDGSLRGTRFASPGVAFAIVALVLFAVMSIASDVMIDHASWLQVLLVSRSTNAILTVATLGLALTVARRLAEPLLVGAVEVEGDATFDARLGIDSDAGRGIDDGSRRDRRVVALVLLAGVLDVAGLIVFMYGLEHAQTWLVGLASSFGPAVTIIVAVAFLGERLRPLQWVGVACILVGMLLIGMP